MALISTSGPSEHLAETPLGHTALHDQVRAHALETFGEEAKALHWLNRPSHLWGVKPPPTSSRPNPRKWNANSSGSTTEFFCLIVYGLTRLRYSSLDGEGARRVGGRCNPIGIAAVYASEHVSLAIR